MIPTFAKRLSAAAVFSLAIAGAAHAQAPSPEQVMAAREVIEVSGAADSIKEIVPIFLDEAKRTLTRTRPEITKDLDDAINVVRPEFTARKEALMDDIATVYAQRFTAQELAEIKTFYTSATGKKLVQNLPGVLQASYERTQMWSQKMSTDIISRLRAELKKKGVDI